MSSFIPDPDKNGAFFYQLTNGDGKYGRLTIQAGATPKIVTQTAGNGFEIVAADGVTVLLSVPESGFVPPSATFQQLIPQASAPSGMTEGAIWYSSVDHAWHGVDDTGDVTFVTQ